MLVDRAAAFVVQDACVSQDTKPPAFVLTFEKDTSCARAPGEQT